MTQNQGDRAPLIARILKFPADLFRAVRESLTHEAPPWWNVEGAWRRLWGPDMWDSADAWTLGKMREHLDLNDPFHAAVAAGTFLRLRELEPQERGRLPRVEESWPHLWVREIPPEGREKLARRAIARVLALGYDLDRLREELDPDDEVWRDDLLDFCRDRDDLEGVRVLLNWAGAGRELEPFLACFDEEARLFVRSIPVVELDDEQLYRASVTCPTSWWTSLLPTASPAA